MGYDVRCYIGTGFNAVNIPDSPALLNQCVYKDVPEIETRQERFLSSVNVKAYWDEIKDTDYVKVGEWFYFVDGIAMVATDVACFTLLPDFITSAGGFVHQSKKFTIESGTTERVMVSDDTLGLYNEPDPLLAPSNELELQSKWLNIGRGSNKVLVETTLDLANTALQTKGRTYYTTNADGSENKITIPTASYIKGHGVTSHAQGTKYAIDDIPANVNPQTQIYDLNDPARVNQPDMPVERVVYNAGDSAREGIMRARELGIEGSIISQYVIPEDFITVKTKGVQGVFDIRPIYDTAIYTDNIITEIKGKTFVKDSAMPFLYQKTYEGESLIPETLNQRIFYSEYTKYGLMSSSGESIEFAPSELLNSVYTDEPKIVCIADPRPDGRPYFRYTHVNRQAYYAYGWDGIPGDLPIVEERRAINPIFFKSCVSGLPWKQVPLVFTSVSGSALNTMHYENSRNIADVNYKYEDQLRSVNAGQNLVKSGVGVVAGAATFVTTGNPMGAAYGIGSAVDGVFGIVKNSVVKNQLADSYNAVKQAEMSDYLAQNTVAVPTVAFPYNSEIIRDFFGNSVLTYRFQYSGYDIKRIDILLNMYGYKVTRQLSEYDFVSREKFNYVSCLNVSISRLPKWWNEGIQMQLKNGVRVWHERIGKHGGLYYKKSYNPVV